MLLSIFSCSYLTLMYILWWSVCWCLLLGWLFTQYWVSRVLFLVLFFWLDLWHVQFLRPGSQPMPQLWPTPQPWQCKIQAVSLTHTTACGNARSPMLKNCKFYRCTVYLLNSQGLNPHPRRHYVGFLGCWVTTGTPTHALKWMLYLVSPINCPIYDMSASLCFHLIHDLHSLVLTITSPPKSIQNPDSDTYFLWKHLLKQSKHKLEIIGLLTGHTLVSSKETRLWGGTVSSQTPPPKEEVSFFVLSVRHKGARNQSRNLRSPPTRPPSRASSERPQLGLNLKR